MLVAKCVTNKAIEKWGYNPNIHDSGANLKKVCLYQTFEIPMQDVIVMQVCQATQHLSGVVHNDQLCKLTILSEQVGN